MITFPRIFCKFIKRQIVLVLFLLGTSINVMSQLDTYSLFALPKAKNNVDFQNIDNPKPEKGSLIYSLEDKKIYHFDGINWVSCCTESKKGLQYYTWKWSDPPKPPNISILSNLGTPITSGITSKELNTKLREELIAIGKHIILFKGVLKANKTGVFNFKTISDDGTRIYIDGVLVHDNWRVQGATEKTSSITLAKGEHNIELWYFDNGEGYFLEFSWGANPNNYTGTMHANQFFIK
ncbi:MAG: PA14 domain-containing protein [Tenacibaculum sp.]